MAIDDLWTRSTRMTICVSETRFVIRVIPAVLCLVPLCLLPGLQVADGDLVGFVQQSDSSNHANRAFTSQYVSTDGGRHWSHSTALGRMVTVHVRRPLSPRHDAVGLLGRVMLPDGAVQSSREPAGDGEALSHPAVTQAGMRVVDLHQWWTVPGSESAAWAFLRSHGPAGADRGDDQPPSDRAASGRSTALPTRAGRGW